VSSVDGMFGIDVLRRAVRILNDNNEEFNQQYTPDQLLRIVEALMRSTHDIMPDQWTDKQVRHAIYNGFAPTWDDEGNAVYPGK
jgi:hypothetical protein